MHESTNGIYSRHQCVSYKNGGKQKTEGSLSVRSSPIKKGKKCTKKMSLKSLFCFFAMNAYTYLRKFLYCGVHLSLPNRKKIARTYDQLTFFFLYIRPTSHYPFLPFESIICQKLFTSSLPLQISQICRHFLIPNYACEQCSLLS